jgi:hypothetical protein
MKTLKLIALSLLLTVFLTNCSKKEVAGIDTTYPEITIAGEDAFPQQCSIIKKGETFLFKTLLTDNMELGSLSVDIHHNFDKHTHSTEVNSCAMDAIKTPVKPYLLIQNYSIPSGLKSYPTAFEIKVPNDIDAGDYHFMIRLTDKEGWQTIRGLSVKIQ